MIVGVTIFQTIIDHDDDTHFCGKKNCCYPTIMAVRTTVTFKEITMLSLVVTLNNKLWYSVIYASGTNFHQPWNEFSSVWWKRRRILVGGLYAFKNILERGKH